MKGYESYSRAIKGVSFFFLPFLLFLASLVPSNLPAAEPAPRIAKYGFSPLFGVLKVRDPVYSSFQAVGPFIFSESSEKLDVCGLRPLFSKKVEKDRGNVRWDLLYPLSRFQSGKKNQNYFVLFYRSDTYHESDEERFYFFPFFWGKTAEGKSYGGVFPFYGHLVNRFQKKDIRFFLWPLYARSEREGVVKTSFLWPFFTSYSGEKGEGFRFWPFFGHEVKKGYYEKNFFLWPFFFSTTRDLDKKNPIYTKAFFPFYMKRKRPPNYRETDFLWPIFRHAEDDEYHRTLYEAWPVFARAQSDYEDWFRVFPFYVHRTTPNYEKWTVLWPLLRRKDYWEGDTEVDYYEFLAFSRFRHERKPGEPWEIKRQNLWPVFCDAHLRDGHSWAFPDPFPVVYEGYRRNWRPIWTVYGGYEREGIRRSRFLWGLYEHVEVGDASLTDIAGLVQWETEGKDISRFSLLQGLLKYENINSNASLRFFFLPWRLRWRATGGVDWPEEDPWVLR